MVFQYRHGDKPLEGYMILRGIGRGGFGEVYYAQSDSGREVALKVIHQNHDIELRGVRHCMNLKSPHLISIFDVKRNADGLPFVIMEYVAGPSLRDLLKEHPDGLGTDKAAYLLREIAKGLSYLHERGIVHRDLKPENIFYEDGYVKIGDYGLSKYISVSRQSGQTISVGTVHYMAPEIGSGNYHRGIDIYSLGIIFYELLTGNVPFNGDSMGEILMKHLTLEPDVSGLEPLLQPVVKKALAKSPSERYGDANDLIADLFRHREIAGPVALLNPASFISRAPQEALPASPEAPAAPPVPSTPLETSPTVAMPGPRPAEAKAMAAAPAVAPVPAPQPAAPAAAPKAAPALGPFFGQDLNQRLVLGLGVAGMAAFALGIFPRNESFAWIASCFGLIAAGSVGPVLVEHWAGPRFQLDESWFSRRFFTLLFSGPLMVLISGSQPAFKSAILPLLLGLVAIDWRERTRTRREEKISLGQAFTAGLFGFIITVINLPFLPKTTWTLLAGVLATMSLAINAASPFEPRKKKGKEAPEPKIAPPAGPPGAAPGPILPPARGAEMNAPAAPIFQAAPPVLAPAGAPAILAASFPRLERPRSGRLIAGVCAGIANRYGMDPVWVRVLFVIIAFFTGIGILAYPILWISMPKEKAPAAIPARPLSALPPSALTAAPKKYRGTRIFLNLTAAGLIFGGAMILVKMHSSGGPMPAVPLNLSMNMIIFGFIFLMVALAVKRRHERAMALAVPTSGWRFSEDNPVRLRQRASRRWSVLGALLVLLALLSAYGGSVLASAAGDRILLNLGFNPAPDFSRWNQHRGHLMVALMLFIPGVFCLLIARQPGGAAHVLRGAVGWAIAGIFLGYFAIDLSLRLLEDPKGFVPFSYSGGLKADELMALLIFGIFTVMCLAWPGKQMN